MRTVMNASVDDDGSNRFVLGAACEVFVFVQVCCGSFIVSDVLPAAC